MTVTIRRLIPGDEAAIHALLATMPETTMFLRSNLVRAGLVDDGSRWSGTYAGAFEGERLVGVAAMFWNASLVVAPGPHAEELASHAIELSGRAVDGIHGPHDEVTRVRAALGFANRPTSVASKQILYALAVEDLIVPAALTRGDVVIRQPRADELATLLEWRMQYALETMSTPDTPDARDKQAASLAGLQERGDLFVAETAAEPGIVSYSAFNASVADLVQVGGVWTPLELRGRGFARCVVAGSLRVARDRGTRRAILFTDDTNVAAQRAYAAIGFRPIGDYSLVYFAH